MKSLSNPHDSFFKQLFKNKEIARDFLQNYLPVELLRILDLDSAQIQKDSFIEDNLKQSCSDLLY